MIEEPVYHLIRPSSRQGYTGWTSNEVFTSDKIQFIIMYDIAYKYFTKNIILQHRFQMKFSHRQAVPLQS